MDIQTTAKIILGIMLLAFPFGIYQIFEFIGGML